MNSHTVPLAVSRARVRFAAWAMLCLASCCAAGAGATERMYYFERVNGDEDLAQNTVNAIVQDRTGFMWVGTQGGLHRYDGRSFTPFQHDPQNLDSLPDNFVTALAEDDRGRLWVGTNGHGVAWLDTRAARFHPDAHATSEINAPRRAIRALAFQAGRGLWVGTGAGMQLLTSEDEYRDVSALDEAAGADIEVNDFALDGDAGVWAATSAGVYRVDARSLSVQRLGEDLPQRAYAIAPAVGGALWVGTTRGLFRLEANGTSRRVWPAPNEAVAPTARLQVFDIQVLADGRVWLAVYGSGVVTVDPRGGVMQQWRANAQLPGSLPEDSVRVLSVDRSGMLWLGGDVHGVARVDPQGTDFVYLVDENTGRNFVDTNNVRSLYEDASGKLWIGTEGDGLKRYDPATGTFAYYNEPLRAALSDRADAQELRVFAIQAANEHTVWVATSVGVFALDWQTGKAWALPFDPARADALPDRTVRDLIVGRDGSLWMGTFAAGLVRYQPSTARWTRYQADDAVESLWHNTVLALHEDRLGRIWVGTFEGLNMLDPATGRMRRIARASVDARSIAGDVIRAIHESPDGSLWFGTHSGLARLDELGDDSARFTRFLTGTDLRNPTVYAILEDDARGLWLATNRGVARLDLNDDTLRRFAREDGLQGLEFNGGARLRLRDGRLAFGGHRGINLVDPRRVSASTFDPPIVVLGYRVGDRHVSLLDPAALTNLRIAPRDDVFSVEFAALDLAAPKRLEYQYRLDGFADRWIANGQRGEVTFTNLDSGDYTLRVRATNRDGRWSAQELRLPIQVDVVWWRSPPMRWAYAALILAAVVLPWLMYRRRMRRERAHHRELREREERLRVALWGSGDEFWDWDIDGARIVRIGADTLLGMEHEQSLSAEQWRKHAVHPDDLPRVERVLDEHVSGQRDFYESEHRIRNAKGEWIWVLSRGKIVSRDEHGKPTRIAGTAHDVTRTREAERDRRIAEEVIRSMSEAVTVTDLEFNFVSINPAFTRMTGYVASEIVGQNSALLNCAQHSEEFHQTLRSTLKRTGHWSGEIWQRRKDGEEFLCWLELSEVTDRAGTRTHWVGVLTDITDRKRAEQELRYLANYDTLTGLPNRTLLGERLAHALIRARRHGSKVAVLFLDLDRFKHVNDSMGHAAGDRLLKAAAARIQASMRESDTVARLGGDEFTVIIEDLVDQQHAERVAQKLTDAFVQPLDIDGRTEVVISPSIGISIYPDHGQIPTDLLKFADTAMYQAKDKGRNTFQTYTEAMDAQARLRASMVGHLHKAVERGEFYLVYQPKMSLIDNRITGVEALLRWRNADLGLVPPSTFIPLAEETGLIVPIGEWVLREACVQLQRWGRSGLTATTMAVNISMLQLLRGELYARLKDMLEDFRLPAHRIELELTESMVMANAEQSISTLTQIKSLGVNLAIDDFGTGYSSLAYLKRLPIDTLKIDKEFVGDITTDPDDEAITATVITMAHSLGLDVIAEGVETPGQLEYLREQRCDEVQGNLISPPLDPERMLKFLLDRKAASAAQAERRGDVREFPLGGKRPER